MHVGHAQRQQQQGGGQPGDAGAPDQPFSGVLQCLEQRRRIAAQDLVRVGREPGDGQQQRDVGSLHVVADQQAPGVAQRQAGGVAERFQALDAAHAEHALDQPPCVGHAMRAEERLADQHRRECDQHAGDLRHEAAVALRRGLLADHEDAPAVIDR
ncbi:hypothetical protein SDC9_71162 [bioreactor metagenome]|uniref:Uncharacterized protein n=1 Tax=bioreactor metagenome TaxID=1076179 RepID=A0A644Y9S9_9ZZZZ